MIFKVNGLTVSPVKVVYRPGREREQPYHLELVLRIPPRDGCHYNITGISATKI